MTAKLAEREGRAAAEIFRHIDAAAHGDVGARAGPSHAAELQHLPCLDGERLPIGHGLAVERRGELGAAKANKRVAVELERRAGQRRLDSGSVLVIADEPVGEPERQRVHRTGGRHADRPIADAPRPILDRGLRAGSQNLDGISLVGEGLERARQHLAAGEDVRGGTVAADNRDWSRGRRSRSRRARPAACQALRRASRRSTMIFASIGS